MARVTMKDTSQGAEGISSSQPAERPGITYVTDSSQRRIGLRKINALAKLRVMKAAGQHSENKPVMGMYLLAASVAEIDGNMEPPPATERQLDAIIAQLDDHGIAACAEAMGQIYGIEDAEGEDKIAGK